MGHGNPYNITPAVKPQSKSLMRKHSSQFIWKKSNFINLLEIRTPKNNAAYAERQN